MTAAENSERFLGALKDQHCRHCELSLFCATGRPGGLSHWCRTCGGYYVPDLDRVVQCSGFAAARPHFKHMDSRSEVSSVRAWKQDHSELSCGWCLTSWLQPTQLMARQERPPIIGFLIQHDVIRKPQ